MKFAGHEGFPLKFGWLKKVYDAAIENKIQNKSINDIFQYDFAIAKFGVGKNMVDSMKHWSLACRILKNHENTDKKYELMITPYGHLLFDEKSADPYLEKADSIWLLHWLLASNDEYSLYFWLFNHYGRSDFSKKTLIKGLEKYYQTSKLPSINTIHRDFDTLIKSYTSNTTKKITSYEELVECPFSELSLINKKNATEFSLDREIKQTLSNEIFLFCLSDYWLKTNANALQIPSQKIQYEEGSPGRVFCMNNYDLGDRFNMLAELTNGALEYSNTSGLDQIIAKKSIKEINESFFKKLLRVNL